MTGCTATGNGGHGISARTSSATITGCYSQRTQWKSRTDRRSLPAHSPTRLRTLRYQPTNTSVVDPG
jgi:hypothetical protein